MSAELMKEIEEAREGAAHLRKVAEEISDGWMAKEMREAADLLEGAAADAATSFDFKAWLAAGCP
jgi:hypothetical protein